jgi:hypothetical protein
MKFFRNISSLFIITGFCGGLFAQAVPAGYEEGLKTITGGEILQNVTFLASDSLKGRAAGTEENNVAAAFIASKFKEYGLKPVFRDRFAALRKETAEEEELPKEAASDISKPGQFENYFQKFNITKSKLSDKNRLSINSKLNSAETEVSFKYMQDYLISFDGSNDIKITAPVVFAGYGIDKGENGYNDFVDASGKETDVKNKIVLIIDGFPQEGDQQSQFIKNRKALYINPLRKAEAARDKGALAVLVMNSPLKQEPPVNFKYEKMIKSFYRESFYVPEFGRKNIPIFYVSKSFTGKLLKETGVNVSELLKNIDKTLKPGAFEVPGKTVTLEAAFESELLPTQNVIGLLEGSDPALKDEIVVVGAHYDHVGFGYYGAMDLNAKGQIHHGADDNGSGTCGLIELAEAFSKTKPRRSVVFIAFSGEENGLLGSNYYVHEQPVFPVSKTVAMVNLDMISRNAPNVLWICGAFYGKDIIKTVEDCNKTVGFDLLYNTGMLGNASDQGPFMKKNIPVLFFFTGLHPDYHTPRDVVEKIDCNKAERVAKLAYLTSWTLASQDSKPVFAPLTQKEKEKLVRESLEKQKKLITK